MAKRGRKRNNYTTSWGETINGLGQLADGRWVDLEDRAHPWSSPDERDALREFRRRQARRRRELLAVVTKRFPLSRIDQEIETAFLPEMEITIDGEDVSIETFVASQPLWDMFGELVRANPKLAAERTGIRELAWLGDLEPPPPALTLQQVRELYAEKQFCSPNESKRSLAYWDEFCQAVQPAQTIKEIKPEHLERYHRHWSRQDLSPKTLRNRYAKIGSILKHAYNLKPAHRPVLQNLRTEFNRICRAGRGQRGQATPIEVEDFKALYLAADVRWRAILLCMLNFAMHPKEAGELLKDELNLRTQELRSTRTKTGVWRVGKLWPETAQAIRDYQETQTGNAAYEASSFLFLTSFNKPYGNAGLTQYYRETLKPRAEKVARRKLHCTLDHIRDGAQNAADEGGADSIHTEMLMGHVLPGSMGSYKTRTPAKTAVSVRCIRDHYRISQLVSTNAFEPHEEPACAG